MHARLGLSTNPDDKVKFELRVLSFAVCHRGGYMGKTTEKHPVRRGGTSSTCSDPWWAQLTVQQVTIVTEENANVLLFTTS